MQQGVNNNVIKYKHTLSLLYKAKALILPIDIQIEMFQKTVKPILLYACEMYGYGNVDML